MGVVLRRIEAAAKPVHFKLSVRYLDAPKDPGKVVL
jgi:hypothetical protein